MRFNFNFCTAASPLYAVATKPKYFYASGEATDRAYNGGFEKYFCFTTSIKLNSKIKSVP